MMSMGRTVSRIDPKSSSLAVVMALLALAAGVLYLPILNHAFVFDDEAHIAGNPFVLQGLGWDGARWAFTTLSGSYWHPLTWLSYMAVVELFGRAPGPQHALGLLLHAANAALLMLVFFRLTGAFWRSALVAALFALHPLHVESVAFAAERKDVLSAFFWLLALLAYTRYARTTGLARYCAAAGLFALSLMSKPMAVTLPFVFLLLDGWPLGRLAGGVKAAALPACLKEKFPLLLLSAAVVVVSLVGGEQKEVLVGLEALPLAARLKIASVSYVMYLIKTAWPSGLAAYYPLPPGGPPAQAWVPALALLTALTVLAVRGRRRRPWLAAGWAWYLVTLLPVIGLVPVGFYARADRYTYLPLIGIFAIAAWGGRELVSGLRRGAAAGAAVSIVLLAVLAVAARVQVGHWRDSITLFGHALDVTEGNWLAHYGVAQALGKGGDFAGAEEHFRKAIDLNPGCVEARNGLGGLLAGRGDSDGAIVQFRLALATRPDYPEALNNLGALYGGRGETGLAASLFARAVSVQPGYGPGWFNLGYLSEQAGDLEGALDHYRRAAALQPAVAEPHIRIGQVLARLGRREEANASCREARRLDPESASAVACPGEATAAPELPRAPAPTPGPSRPAALPAPP